LLTKSFIKTKSASKSFAKIHEGNLLNANSKISYNLLIFFDWLHSFGIEINSEF